MTQLGMDCLRQRGFTFLLFAFIRGCEISSLNDQTYILCTLINTRFLDYYNNDLIICQLLSNCVIRVFSNQDYCELSSDSLNNFRGLSSNTSQTPHIYHPLTE